MLLCISEVKFLHLSRDFFVNRTILVTGGAGFIGSHLVGQLLREGVWDVTVVDDLNDFYSPEIKRANLKTVQESGDFRFVEADIRCGEALRDIFDETRFRLHRPPCCPGRRPAVAVAA